MRKSELFESFDLFDVRDFGKVRRRRRHSSLRWRFISASLAKRALMSLMSVSKVTQHPSGVTALTGCRDDGSKLCRPPQVAPLYDGRFLVSAMTQRL